MYVGIYIKKGNCDITILSSKNEVICRRSVFLTDQKDYRKITKSFKRYGVQPHNSIVGMNRHKECFPVYFYLSHNGFNISLIDSIRVKNKDRNTSTSYLTAVLMKEDSIFLQSHTLSRKHSVHEKKRKILNSLILVVFMGSLTLYFLGRYVYEPVVNQISQNNLVDDIRESWLISTETYDTVFSDSASDGSFSEREISADEAPKIESTVSDDRDEEEYLTDGGIRFSEAAQSDAAEPASLYNSDIFSGMIGLLYVPVWGENYVAPILEDTTKEHLKKAVCHYRYTAMPGEIGNFAVAAHRSLRGGLFQKLTSLRLGDQIIVETKSYIYIYEIYSEIEKVKANQMDEIAGVPHSAGVKPDKAVITLQACEISNDNSVRIIVHGELVSAELKS